MFARNSDLYWLARSSASAFASSSFCARTSSVFCRSRCCVYSSRCTFVCSSSACCVSSRACVSIKTRPRSSSSSFDTRSSSCCTCNSSLWRCVSSSKSTIRERYCAERSAMPIASAAFSSNSRVSSTAFSSPIKPTSSTPITLPSAIMGAITQWLAGADASAEPTVRKSDPAPLTSITRFSSSAWPSSPWPRSIRCGTAFSVGSAHIRHKRAEDAVGNSSRIEIAAHLQADLDFALLEPRAALQVEPRFDIEMPHAGQHEHHDHADHAVELQHERGGERVGVREDITREHQHGGHAGGDKRHIGPVDPHAERDRQHVEHPDGHTQRREPVDRKDDQEQHRDREGQPRGSISTVYEHWLKTFL